MGHVFQDIMQYFHQHPNVGLLFAFIIAFSESLPLIGTIIPGSVTMTAVGALVGTSVLPAAATFTWAIIGAFLGDCIGFWVGSRFKTNLPHTWPFSRYPKLLSYSEDFFRKHGGKSIIIGRFVGPARSTIPLIAGLLQMTWPRFALAALPSAILWAFLYITPGILLGALALELPPGKTTEFILIGLGVIVFLWFVFWAIQRFFYELARIINKFVDRAWDWLNTHHSSKFFIKMITNVQNPRDHHQLHLALLCLISLILFIIILIDHIFKLSLTHLNEPVFHFLQSLRNRPTDTFFILFTLLGAPVIVSTTAVITAAILAWKKQWRACAHLILTLLLVALCVSLFKHLHHSPRPDDFLILDKSTSFPSGHTTFSLAVYGFITFLIAQRTSQEWRWITYLIASFIILFITLSRIYLGAHWLTDILGSITLGFTILLGVITNYRRMPNPASALTISLNTLLLTVIPALLIPWLLFTHFELHKMRLRFTPYSLEFHITSQQWWENPFEYLPIYRNNRFGDIIQPFNVQWKADLNNIKQSLSVKGWKEISNKQLIKNTLQRFSSYNPEFHMPLFPWLYLNKPPAIVLIKHLDKDILELRLWKTNVTFVNSPNPVWIGTINLHTSPEKLITIRGPSTISFDSGDITEVLHNDIAQNFRSKIITIPTEEHPEKIQALNWKGQILIISTR